MTPIVPPVGEERNDEYQESEILRLSKCMELDGDMYDREVAYLSDHQVMHNFAKNGAWEGWTYWKLWEKIEDVYQIAETKRAKGWTLTFNPIWQPGLREFMRQVNF